MVGLRHIWTMSSFYCRDENMQVLLCQISHVFTEKVRGIVALDTIFRYNINKNIESEDVSKISCWGAKLLKSVCDRLGKSSLKFSVFRVFRRVPDIIK